VSTHYVSDRLRSLLQRILGFDDRILASEIVTHIRDQCFSKASESSRTIFSNAGIYISAFYWKLTVAIGTLLENVSNIFYECLLCISCAIPRRSTRTATGDERFLGGTFGVPRLDCNDTQEQKIFDYLYGCELRIRAESDNPVLNRLKLPISGCYCLQFREDYEIIVLNDCRKKNHVVILTLLRGYLTNGKRWAGAKLFFTLNISMFHSRKIVSAVITRALLLGNIDLDYVRELVITAMDPELNDPQALPEVTVATIMLVGY
jgi:hypothetical protein